jgi:hypothetical protein
MDKAILMIRCRTLETFLNKIEASDFDVNIAVEASKIADKIIEATSKSGFTGQEYESVRTNLEHFSLAVFADNTRWARESLNNVKELSLYYF